MGEKAAWVLINEHADFSNQNDDLKMTIPTIQIHPHGPCVSRLVFGVWRLNKWNLDAKGVLHLIETCLDNGLTTFDHADIYGGYTCEALFGEALRRARAIRSKMQLISKCGIKLVSSNRPEHLIKHYDTGREHILASVETSLQNLHTDYLDLLLLHRPDPFMNADETAAALESLVRSGKVRQVGVSNFTPSQFDLLASRLSVPLVTNQIELSVLHTQPFVDGTLDHCQRLRFSPMAWSPLAGGAIFKGDTEQAVRVRAVLEKVAAQWQAGIDHVALAWLLSHPANIVPVIGTGNIERIRSVADVFRLALTREQWFEIWIASTGKDVP